MQAANIYCSASGNHWQRRSAAAIYQGRVRYFWECHNTLQVDQIVCFVWVRFPHNKECSAGLKAFISKMLVPMIECLKMHCDSNKVMFVAKNNTSWLTLCCKKWVCACCVQHYVKKYWNLHENQLVCTYIYVENVRAYYLWYVFWAGSGPGHTAWCWYPADRPGFPGVTKKPKLASNLHSEPANWNPPHPIPTLSQIDWVHPGMSSLAKSGPSYPPLSTGLISAVDASILDGCWACCSIVNFYLTN